MADGYQITKQVIFALWGIWGVIWLLAAFNVKRTVERQAFPLRALYLVLVGGIYVGFLCVPGVAERFFVPNVWSEGAGVGLCAGGLGWALWARRCLGRNWSGRVVVKEGHELVTCGPYRFSRHPIYTGVLAAMVGTMLALLPAPVGVFVAGVSWVTFYLKLRLEERVMEGVFPEGYVAYRKRVRAALVPFVI